MEAIIIDTGLRQRLKGQPLQLTMEPSPFRFHTA